MFDLWFSMAVSGGRCLAKVCIILWCGENHKKHAGCVDSRIVQHNGERGTSSGIVCQELSSRGCGGGGGRWGLWEALFGAVF